jgi:hypothetical protein
VKPVIVLGMGRSGTSLVSNLLQRSGIFMGENQDNNGEALFFQLCNIFIFNNAIATWDRPDNMLLVNDEFSAHIHRALNYYLSGRDAKKYYGGRKHRKLNDIRNIDFPFGWKDPRNTFTIKYWLDEFQEAYILHVHRNPAAVTKSLQAREESVRTKKSYIEWQRKAEKRLSAQVLGYQLSYRVLHSTEAYALWYQYLEQAFKIETLGQPVLHVSYENLISDSANQLNNILKFIHHNKTESEINSIIKIISTEKKQENFPSPPSGLDEKIITMMRRLGYA